MSTVKDIIALAEAEVGYLEKKSNAQLDDKTANAGDKNFTKYARDLVSWVGSPYAQGTAWCDVFYDWLMIKTFGKDKAKELLGGWSAYTPTSAQYYKNMNRWYTTPQVGDQIFFKNTSRIYHTGIVYKVDGSKVYTIEGNTSSAAGVVPNGGAVEKKSYALNYNKIAGYGRPNYPTDKKVESKSTALSYPCKGIDVSEYQKNIEYGRLKQSGVQFAIIKIIKKNNAVDPLFETHYSGFTGAGIPVMGVYNYVYSKDVESAKIAARAVIKTLNGRKTTVFMDVEDQCLQGIGAQLINIINAYQSVIEGAGLPFAIYTGLSFYRNYIKPYEASLNCKSFWIARYYNGYTAMTIPEAPNDKYKPDVKGLIGWQYSSSGTVLGAGGRLDLNIFYSPVGSKPASKHGVVTANVLNVRNKPGTSGAVVGTIRKGDVVDIYGTDTGSGWYQIGVGRYVSNKYIQII